MEALHTPFVAKDPIPISIRDVSNLIAGYPGTSRQVRHNRPFELVGELEWDRALVVENVRRDYGEVRLQVTAPMMGQSFIAIVTQRGHDLRGEGMADVDE